MKGQIRWFCTRRPCCELDIRLLYRSSPGNPNICKAQTHNLNPNIRNRKAQARNPIGSPSQAEIKSGQDHQPIKQLFRRVAGIRILEASEGPFQGSYPDEGCHRGGSRDLT